MNRHIHGIDMVELPSSIRQVVIEHLNGAIQHADEGKFVNLSIQTNRMITESVLWSDEPNLVLPGFTLRLAYLELEAGRNQNAGNVVLVQKNALLDFCKELNEILRADSPIRADNTWKQYQIYFDTFWKAHRNTVDGKWYQPNPEFVNVVYDWAFDHLNTWSESVGEIRGDPMNGIIGEIERIIRAHGATTRQLIVLGMFQSIRWRIEYIIWQTLGKDNLPDEKRVKELLQPLIIEAIQISKEKDDTVFYSNSTKFVKEMMLNWRSDFIRYYDLFTYHQEQMTKRIIMDSSSKQMKKTKVPSRKPQMEEP